jgi:predicted RNase H-like HicB family nuclease
VPENHSRGLLSNDLSQLSSKRVEINSSTTNYNINININSSGPSGGRQSTNMGVLTEYIEAAMRKTVLEQLGDGSWYANIPPCPGVWANEKTPEECMGTLREALEEWLLLKLLDNDPLEEIDGKALKVVEESWSQ